MTTPEPAAGIGLEPTRQQVRAVLTAAVDYVAGFLDRLPQAPPSDHIQGAGVLADEAVRRPPTAGGHPWPNCSRCSTAPPAPG